MSQRGQSGGASPTPPSLSFEFFPPKSPSQAEALDHAVARLARLQPDFVSVTYGAGGTSRERSLDCARRMADTFNLTTAAHLTCVGASREEIGTQIGEFQRAGLRRFVALRGDPPGSLQQPYHPHPQGFSDTADLVRALKDAGAEDVAVSAYPERHPQSPDWATELDVLKRKADAGADFAMTQFFFDVTLFEAYLERVSRAGINLPIIPGLMPISRFSAVSGFAEKCGASVPAWLRRRFDGLADASEASKHVGISVATEQVQALIDLGVGAFHFYTLNQPDLCEAVCDLCGLGASRDRAAA